MKKIEAIVRPEKREAIQSALEEAGYPGVTISEIEGHGKQKGAIQHWRREGYRLELLRKMKVEIVCLNKDAKKLVKALHRAAFTGGVGDGKIFIYDVADALRIRTGERGDKALA